jgi:hypothetical protein|tara:strand:- start:144 stop:335 length:192 start_codon:yes stop_codon:yes gene_type:complete
MVKEIGRLSKKSEAIMVAHLEDEIKHFSRPSVKDGDDCWDCFVDGKLTALEQVLQFVQQKFLV